MGTEKLHHAHLEQETTSGGLFAVLPFLGVIPSSSDATAMLFGVALIVLTMVGWWGLQHHLRRRRRRAATQAGSNSSSDSQIGTASSVDSPRRATVDSGLLRPEPSTDSPAAEKLFFASDTELIPRRCPECERTFPSVFDICPFDSIRLQDDLRRPRKDGESRHLPRRYCTGCDRRYELTAMYCYHDGQQLLRDSEDVSESAPSYHICRECGWESNDSNTECCPRDGRSLSILEPAERSFVPPPFPYNRCRQCGHVGAPNEIQCPVDGSLLLPELSARLTALPPTGHGPRRRVCTECGAEFGDQCTFCSYDGTTLVDMN